MEDECNEIKEDTWSDAGGDQVLPERNADRPQAAASSESSASGGIQSHFSGDAVRPVIPR